MANFDGTEASYGTEPGGAVHEARGGVAALANWAGALISLGLIAGMAVWAVELTVRDVSGVPVIEALEGPMRQAPADPGGMEAPHQGLAVNRIAEGAEAPGVPDRLVIAPPPLELRPVELRPVPARQAAVAEAGGAPEASDTSDSGPAVTAEADTASLIERLLREAHGTGFDEPDPAGAVAATPASLTRDATAPVAPDAIPATVPGVVRSPRPSARPVRFAPREAGLPVAAPRTGVTELAVAELAAGTRLVQLGAFDTADIARGEWDRLAASFPDYFADRPRVVEEAASGGQTFFRLRAAGFDDLAGARRFCAVLVAEGAACIPVTVR